MAAGGTRRAGAIRVGDYKLMIGAWGIDKWCDINSTDQGLSCVHLNSSTGPGGVGKSVGVDMGDTRSGTYRGEGGVMVNSTAAAAAAAAVAVSAAMAAPPTDWWSTVQLYDVVSDPRELHDLSLTKPGVVQQLMARFLHYNR
jgi:hypothetical protein